ncbi:odorant receptor 135-1 [Chanos chanos]|uniref:Odorant receptor 135-1 n=1 Tax=Chanos chanos TaxID=29144 RepID=A0A6J2WB47_CHACN|nr:odorant receptor 131-2-like [Chanos chanos]
MNNSSETDRRKDFFEEVVFKNLTVVLFGIIINAINSLLVFTFVRTPSLRSESRYILYMQLVFNDIIMLSVSVALHVLGYTVRDLNVIVCCILILIANNVHKNMPLNLAGMALERFVAVCYPLHHSLICTVQRTKMLIAIIWCLGALPGVIDLLITLALRPLSFFTAGRLCYHANIFSLKYNIDNNLASNISHLCFVWVTLFYTYFRVLFSAKAAASDPVKAQKAQRTILLHGIQLVLCMTSYVTPIVEATLIVLFPDYRSVILFCNYIISSILPRLLSPLIYGLRDQTFKKHLEGLVLCRLIKGSVDPTV